MTLKSREWFHPDAYGEGCPSDCGCPETPIDCPRHYQIEDIKLSAEAKLNTNAVIYFAALMERKHMEMVEMCNGDAVVLKSGGWCLSSTSEERGTIEWFDGREIAIRNLISRDLSELQWHWKQWSSMRVLLVSLTLVLVLVNMLPMLDVERGCFPSQIGNRESRLSIMPLIAYLSDRELCNGYLAQILE